MSRGPLDKILYGGMGYGNICIPKFVPNLILLIFMPPIYVWTQQHRNNYQNPKLIIINFVLTSLFYFPGLVHALSVMDCAV